MVLRQSLRRSLHGGHRFHSHNLSMADCPSFAHEPVLHAQSDEKTGLRHRGTGARHKNRPSCGERGLGNKTIHRGSDCSARATRAIRRIAAFGDDALQSEPEGVLEDERPVVVVLSRPIEGGLQRFCETESTDICDPL